PTVPHQVKCRRQPRYASADYNYGSFVCCSQLKYMSYFYKSHDLKSFLIRVFIINKNRVVSCDTRPTFYRRDDSGFPGPLRFFFDPPDTLRSDVAFMDTHVSSSELPFCIPLRHTCGSAGSTGRAIQGIFPHKYRISSRRIREHRRTGPLNMT